MPIGIIDEEYSRYLQSSIPGILDEFNPDLVLYQGGADPYKNDQLGNLSLTISGLKQRDQFLFEECQSRNIPVAVTLGGGYAVNTEDTVQIHFNTCKRALEIFK